MGQRTNADWLNDLGNGDDLQRQTLEDLHTLIVNRLSCALSTEIMPDFPKLEMLIESAAQKTLFHVQKHSSGFVGNCAFTSWVLKLAVRQALLELRHQRFHAVSPMDCLPETPPAFFEVLANDKNLQQIHCIFEEELTENQRKAIRAMVMFRMPKEEVAQQLGMERADYFKMIHDARLRLKHRFEADGWFLPIGVGKGEPPSGV
jgi:DNA-directed RNA polymerase specialized sigma24 family protein